MIVNNIILGSAQFGLKYGINNFTSGLNKSNVFDISTKPAKRKMLEVLTTLTYANPNKKKAQGYFQIKYATVIDILDLKIEKKELEKIILCDLQTKIYPDLEQKFLTILKNSGLPDLKFGKKIDFEELYKARLN